MLCIFGSFILFIISSCEFLYFCYTCVDYYLDMRPHGIVMYLLEGNLSKSTERNLRVTHSHTTNEAKIACRLFMLCANNVKLTPAKPSHKFKFIFEHFLVEYSGNTRYIGKFSWICISMILNSEYSSNWINAKQILFTPEMFNQTTTLSFEMW